MSADAGEYQSLTSDEATSPISDKKERNVKTISLSLSMMGMGSMHAVIGPTLLDLASNLHSNIDEVSLIFVGQACGFIIGTIMAGLVIDKMDHHLFLGALMLIASGITTLVPLMPSITLLFIVGVCRGTCIRALEIACNVSLLAVWGKASNMPMQILHLALAVGCFISPILVKPFLGTSRTLDSFQDSNDPNEFKNYSKMVATDMVGSNIEFAYILLSIYTFFVGVFSLVVYKAWPRVYLKSGFLEVSKEEESRSERSFRIRFVALGTVVLMIYFGVLLTYDGYLTTFGVISDLHMSLGEATSLAASFWAAFGIGRLIACLYANIANELVIVIFDIIGCLAGAFILAFKGDSSEIMLWTGTITYGFFSASMGPATISFAHRYIDITGQIGAIYMIGAALGEAMLPFFIGQMIENYSAMWLIAEMSKNPPPSDKNKKIWSSNLLQFHESKTSRKHKTVENISQMHRIPKEQYILDRFRTLASRVKSKKERIKIIAGEVKQLWNKLNLPIQQGKSTVERKIQNVIKVYERQSRKPGNYDFTKLFDVTDARGEWLCEEDKEFYELQLSSKGKVGYSTTKEDLTVLHPRKLKLLKRKSSVTEEFVENSTEVISESDENVSEEQCFSSDEDFENPSTFKRQKTDSAVRLVTTAKLSTRKARKVCQTLSESGVSIPTPTQSGIYKAVMKKGEELKKNFLENLKNDQWCLHFDGKTINKMEHQVVVVKNESKEVRLAVVQLINGKGETIFNGIKTVLDEFELWESIKAIVSDTTAANTGICFGAVTLLQKHFVHIGLDKPPFIGCQHHILDTILKHVLNEHFDGTPTSPNLSYSFISRITEEYEQLKTSFNNTGKSLKKTERDWWRDDMAFLDHLISCYKVFKSTGSFPKVNFKSLPALSNATWNSRAIYTLLAFILIPDYRQTAKAACDFISGSWADIWFSAQSFNPADFENLSEACKGHPKALKSLRKFWSTEPSPIPMQRSNICAERAIKVMQDLLPLCTSNETLNIKFLLTNARY